MGKPSILLQLDSDAAASVFDAVVAIDAGVEHLLQSSGVQPPQVQGLVHGCMFTRGPQDLSRTAIFIGGSNVAAGEALLAAVQRCFFGPLRVSVMLDANGANTTAAAAVLAAARHVPLAGNRAVVLGATGPVGQRAARLLAAAGSKVLVASRDEARAAAVCDTLRRRLPAANLIASGVADPTQLAETLRDAQIVIAAGAAGIALLPRAELENAATLRVAVDLNAVPPLGIEGVETMDKGQMRGSIACYGAMGVGGTKMKIHKAALQKLFAANDQILDAEEIFALGQELESQRV